MLGKERCWKHCEMNCSRIRGTLYHLSPLLENFSLLPMLSVVLNHVTLTKSAQIASMRLWPRLRGLKMPPGWIQYSTYRYELHTEFSVSLAYMPISFVSFRISTRCSPLICKVKEEGGRPCSMPASTSQWGAKCVAQQIEWESGRTFRSLHFVF